jgi:copper(I)-binding protein
MKLILRRRTLLGASVAVSTGLLSPGARACEYFLPTLRVIHPWTRATPAGATSAIVSMQFADVVTDDRLVQVRTPVARGADIGGRTPRDRVDFPIAAGVPSELSETGTYLRLTGLLQALELGRSYPLTLVFAQGGSVDATLSIDYTPRRFR